MKNIHSALPGLEETLTAAILAEINSTFRQGTESTSAAYVQTETFIAVVANRLINDPRFIAAISDSVAAKTGRSKPDHEFLTLAEAAERFRYHPKHFARIAQPKFGLQKIYFQRRVHFRFDDVQRVLEEIEGTADKRAA